jgi:UDP-N-acetylmuramoyl-tripeptide--D-alanyl-D-alanine ligase
MKQIVITLLNWESRLILKKYKPFIVAVTGSVGKTSTKDAIYDALKDLPGAGHVRKSEKSFNSEIGTPLTVIGVPNAWHSMSGWFKNLATGLDLILRRREYPDTLILEIGADHPGDIRRVTQWLHPDISVITRISRTPVHVEFFNSPEEVFEEKAFLATAVKSGGVLVVYGDDDRTLSMGDRVKDRGVSVVSYGMSEQSAVRALDAQIAYVDGAPVGMKFVVSHHGRTVPVTLDGVLGAGAIYSALAAIAVATARGGALPQEQIRFDMPKGRMNVIPGKNGSTLIDDAYNSSPDAAISALAVLKDIQMQGRKIAALGDMLELGKFAAQEHRRIGVEAASALGQNGILVTVGQRSRLTAEEALKSGMPAESVRAFDSSREAAEFLAGIVAAGDVVLVKGSQGVRMERVSVALLRAPERAQELLVRQEKEWLEKA